MRQLVVGLVVAGITVLAPLGVFASNQEVANAIHDNLKVAEKAGELSQYKIGIKYQEGTAWLMGRVSSETQMQKAVEVASGTEGVKKVVNNLTVAGAADATQSARRPAVHAGKNGLADRLQGFVKKLNPTSMKVPAQSQAQPASQPIARTQPAAPAQAPVKQASASTPLTPPTPVKEYAVQPAAPVAAQPIPTQQPMMRQPPMPVGYMQNMQPQPMAPQQMAPQPMVGSCPVPVQPGQAGCIPAQYDQACMPNYAWPSYAAYPNYAGVTYPRQYSATAWPFIGPFYPYPQVPLGWRRVTLEWDDGWWWLDFKDSAGCCNH